MNVKPMLNFLVKCLARVWRDDSGQDIAEYALMLVLVLVLVLATVQMVGKSANNIFSNAASALNQ